MFNSDLGWKQEYVKFRESYLFIVSGGNNFRPDQKAYNLAGRLSEWLQSELHGFYTILLDNLCSLHVPLRQAVVQAYCRDELAKAHTDLLWMTGGLAPLVLRDAGGARAYGLQLRSLCAQSCRALVPSVIRQEGDLHKGDRVAILFTQCCKLRHRLSVAASVEVPEEREHDGVPYVLERWPGGFPYELERDIPVDQDQDQEVR
ncbi:hypothetical protein FRC09_008647 [Ceratobasidium sp. 395]|nr:hypothetical protein FRC09_008647 [Ceratobasidium sp. 395]